MLKINRNGAMAVAIMLGVGAVHGGLLYLLVPLAADKPHEIVAKIEYTDLPTATEVMQECGIYWVENSATLMERKCNDRVFSDRAAAAAFIADAKKSFRASRPPNVKRWTIWSRPVKAKNSSEAEHAVR